MKHLLLIAILLFSTVTWGSDFVTKGDIRKSNIKMFKSFFIPEKCDQIVLNAKKNFRDNYSDKVNSKLLINLYKKTINKKYKRN